MHINSYILKVRIVAGVALFLMLLPGLSFAQAPMSLPEILKEIERNNPGLKAYDSQVRSQESRVDGAGSWMAPMIGAGTFMTPYPGQEIMSDSDKGAFMFSAEQEIPNPAKVKAKREYLNTLAETYVLGKSEQFNELRSRARSLYFELLIEQKKSVFQLESKQIMGTMKKLADIRYPYNQVKLNEVFKAESRLAEAENMLIMTEAGIRQKKILLNALMNRPVSEKLEIDTNYKISFSPLARLDSNYLLDTRSDVRHMEHSIHSMKANINAMKQEAKPDFKLRFDHMSSYSAMMPRQYTVMGMISLPIAPWSSKMYRSEIKSMNFEVEAMRRQKEDMITGMLAMAESMTLELSAMEKQIVGYEQRIMPALQKNLELSLLSYQENKMELNMVMDSWETRNMTEMNYLDLLERYYKMVVEYEKIIER